MKNPLFVLVNDIHIDKPKCELVKDIFKQLIDVCEKYNVPEIVLGGDVFTNRSGQPLTCLATFQEILDMLKKQDIYLHVIPGNHDKTDADDCASYVDVYRGNENLFLYRQEHCRIFGNCLVCFIPYFGDEKWKEQLEKVKLKLVEYEKFEKGKLIANNPKFLVTHIAIDGVRNNDGSEVVSELKPTDLDCFAKVFVGHYHNASRVGKNIYYTGSAYQNNHGESIVDKGCTIVYDDATIEHVDLKFPKYIKHVIDVNDSETLRNLIEKYEGEDYDHVRFIFQGKKVDASKVDLNFISSKGIECQFESIEEKEAINDSINIDSLNYDKRSISKDFLKFCSENQIKGKHMKYGLNLIKEI